MDSEIFQQCEGGITAPKGFIAGGFYCGIRKAKKDIALIVSEKPAITACVFTLNKVIAAPLIVDKQQLKKSKLISAVVVNSGNANACTGEKGIEDAWTMINTTASALKIPSEQILVSSTGVIGQYLPIDKIVRGIHELSTKLSKSGNEDAAEAIMTTDLFKKECAVKFSIGNSTVTIGGMAKGSGMIAPNMATMLAFITTDASIEASALDKALRHANERSFNCITVDGDTSTNDMVVVLANGMANNQEIIEDTKEYDKFYKALEFVMIELAKMIVRDGEGATKFIEVVVNGASSESEAQQAARAVANSNLVKTAIHGADANWGRVIAAVGYSGINFDPAKVSISFNNVPVLEKNYQIVIDEEKAKAALLQKDITVLIDLHQGSAKAKFWTCDLSKEYVNINASYRS